MVLNLNNIKTETGYLDITLDQFFQPVNLSFYQSDHAGLLHYIKRLELTTVIVKFLEMEEISNRFKP